MNRMLVPTVLLGMIVSLHCEPQQPGSSQELSEPQQQMVKQIQSGDRRAILAAGNSGDRAFVPYLKKAIGKSPVINDTPESDAQLALAKLDQPEELRSVLCELRSDDPQVSYRAIRKASYVGGWATVQTLEEMLTMDETHSRTKWGPPPGDAIYPSTNETAVQVLRSMFQDDAKREPKSNLAAQVIFWTKWISEHEAEFERQPPLGKGLPKTKSCADGSVVVVN